MTKSKKSHITTIIIMILVVGFIFYAFMNLANKEKPTQELLVEQSEVEKILDISKTEGYPPTPREVIKFYGRIVKSIYSGELSEEEIRQLGDVVLSLYSVELLAVNPYDEYMQHLLDDVDLYEQKKKTVINYVVDTGENTLIWKNESSEFARVYATFTTKENSMTNKTYEEFILVKDESNRWKIVGWSLVDKDEI